MGRKNGNRNKNRKQVDNSASVYGSTEAWEKTVKEAETLKDVSQVSPKVEVTANKDASQLPIKKDPIEDAFAESITEEDNDSSLPESSTPPSEGTSPQKVETPSIDGEEKKEVTPVVEETETPPVEETETAPVEEKQEAPKKASKLTVLFNGIATPASSVNLALGYKRNFINILKQEYGLGITKQELLAEYKAFKDKYRQMFAYGLEFYKVNPTANDAYNGVLNLLDMATGEGLKDINKRSITESFKGEYLNLGTRLIHDFGL